MFASARVLLKPYRFEVGAAAIAALILGVGALIVTYRLVSIPMPAGCFEAWVQAPGYDYAPDCEHATFLWSSINANEAGPVFSALLFLPFLAGLIAGVPIVARELEMGTAQTAWFLWPSRMRWLGRKLLPVLVVLGLTVGFAAAAAVLLDTTQPAPNVLNSTSQGPILVARAFAAFGGGLLVGAAIGRSLPAFLIAAVLCAVVGWAAEDARFGWLRDRAIPISQETWYRAHYSFGYFWRTPEGELIPWVDDTIYSRVPPGAMEQTEDPDSGPEHWLETHGYSLVPRGVTREIINGWVPIEVGAMSLIGLVGIAGTAVIVNRRRPR
jgi:hypothetical protein